MADTRTYKAPWLDVHLLASAIRDWLTHRDFATQVIPTVEGLIVQGRKIRLIEHGAALTVNLVKKNDVLTVELGTSSWGLNAAEGVAALLLFWPLAAVPAWAAYQIKSTMDEIWGVIDGYVAQGRDRQGAPVSSSTGPSGAARPLANPPASVSGPQRPTMGHAARPAGPSKLNNTVVSPWACPACGAPVTAGARFCTQCGKRLGET